MNRRMKGFEVMSDQLGVGVIGCGGFGLFALQQFVQVAECSWLEWPARRGRPPWQRRSGMGSRTSSTSIDYSITGGRHRLHFHAAVSALRAIQAGTRSGQARHL